MPDAPRRAEPGATLRSVDRLFEAYATRVDARDGHVLRRLKGALSGPIRTPERAAGATEADHRRP